MTHDCPTYHTEPEMKCNTFIFNSLPHITGEELINIHMFRNTVGLSIYTFPAKFVPGEMNEMTNTTVE